VNEIDDKSKSDFLAKTIAILQSTWFILQCIARGIQGLSLTELELATLALACLNAITSVFWLRKPLGLQEPVKVKLKSREISKSVQDSDEPASPVKQVSKIVFSHAVFTKLTCRKYENFDFSVARAAARRVFDSITSGISNIFRGSCHEHPVVFFFQWCFVLPTYTLALILFLPFTFFPFAIVLFLRIIEPLVTSITKPPTDNRAFLITRIVKSLREIRYRLTSSISAIFSKWLSKIWRYNDASHFWQIPFFSPAPTPIPLHRTLFTWFFVLPALFFALCLLFLLLIPPVFIFFSILFIFTSAFNILASSKVVAGRSHVPAFYAPETTEGRYSRMIVFAFFGVIFGGIHCVGWNFLFPTRTEQYLWRFTSLTITFIPVVVAPIDFFLTMQSVVFVKNMSKFARALFSALDLVMTVLVFAYVMARLSLIAQALALLRRQPSDAYLAVDWTQYVPHVV